MIIGLKVKARGIETGSESGKQPLGILGKIILISVTATVMLVPERQVEAVTAASEVPKATAPSGPPANMTPASERDELRALLEKGVEALRRLRSGDKEAANEAEEALERALAAAPENPRVLTYHGSLLILRGKDAKLPLHKMRLVNSGLKEMDQAVELAPNDVEVRMQRAMHCISLPSIFDRADTAVADFSYMFRLGESRPGLIAEELQAGIGLNLAEAYMRKHEPRQAERILEQVIRRFPESEEATEANRRLQELRRNGKATREGP